ncbi:hypothetical protein CIB93_26460 [Streptomyces sp. WZ.A104]|nr:hypothetical protein CIB93_26460 [Streptomyces sp. WZ.A104]
MDRAARQAAADANLAARIRAVHLESDGTYGVPRITAELREEGERVNHKRIARVMRNINLAGVRLRRRHRTTVPDRAAAKAPDLIGRDFTATEPNTKVHILSVTSHPSPQGSCVRSRMRSRAGRRTARSPGRRRPPSRRVSCPVAAAETRIGPRALRRSAPSCPG